ncbi:hypothetical protein TMatcc_000144 [Talaromyces marneffei ATCC 18224]
MPKRRKTSLVVTRIEIMIRMMMIQVWSVVIIRQDLGQVEENSTTLVEDLDAWFDFEVFSYGDVQRVEGWFRLPKEVGHIQHIRCYSLID